MMHYLKNIMIAVVESMINKFEEDETRNQERQKKIQKEKSRSYCTDNCSDSDSSFNQVCCFVLHLCLEMVFNNSFNKLFLSHIFPAFLRFRRKINNKIK